MGHFDFAVEVAGFSPHPLLLLLGEGLDLKCPDESVEKIECKVADEQRKCPEDCRRECEAGVTEEPTNGSTRKTQFSPVLGDVTGMMLVLAPKLLSFHGGT